MKDSATMQRRFVLDRILLIGSLVLQVAILARLLWPPDARGPSLRHPDSRAGDAETMEGGIKQMQAVRSGGRNAAGPNSVVPFMRHNPDGSEYVLERVQERDADMTRFLNQTLSEFARFAAWVERSDDWRSIPRTPAIDIGEGSDAYKLVADVSGMRTENLDLTLCGRTLTLTAHRNTDKSAMENHKTYAQTFRFPRPVVNDERAYARISNGVLRVVLPKAKTNVAEERLVRLLHAETANPHPPLPR